jgi:hypothetical protein
MDPFVAGMALFEQVHALLHPARYACTFVFNDDPLLIKVTARSPAILPGFVAEYLPSAAELSTLEDNGQAERFGAIAAQELLRQLNAEFRRATEESRRKCNPKKKGSK